MSAEEDFAQYLGQCPLVAIIRGVTPEEAVAVGKALLAAGIAIIEVPLNSPQPFESIDRLAKALGDRALVGAGTVLDPLSVARVKDAGGRLVVAPNTNAQVIAAAVQAGMVAAPGYFTPTEAFVALDAGAQALKLFPAEGASPAVLKAQRAVLPRQVPVLVVGGVQPDTMTPWLEAGANGFGLGSGLYVPGRSADEVEARARAYVAGLAK
ncbi:2-dehydro-3-deoxy-6-phosphogalactonate aldolase [Sphingomonas astaxanthinifaciens]|uniref:2-dehydro-3-deoxy-6-phosphogalactonate aldolase n=1 Tax=Sphingomonas astaxanthinifaciens DSM 22298 TaxID=1123267 RepID=A0ABQ5Z5Y2_9SPHN|nr:2-dehydro-3-deoxy-6-phosphogalactonate aldolase [Sphingomonas astaxanthinifaciens]GLR48179.1 2-dehydro-3-deoxy-6-phosphogalactonate aldolase [Sphingomonas astaxanthinifaciens DSM 22298]